MAWIHDSNGNVLGRAHANPILDIRLYQVEFAGGKAIELTTNVIAESMYTKCDNDGNEHLLFDLLLDYQKGDKAVSLSDQQTSVWGKQVTYKSTVG